MGSLQVSATRTVPQRCGVSASLLWQCRPQSEQDFVDKTNRVEEGVSQHCFSLYFLFRCSLSRHASPESMRGERSDP